MAACDRCLIDPRDYNGRANLMWTATLALNGLTAAGLGRVGFPMHLIEHSLSALYNVPHGAGLAVVMLGWLRAHRQSLAERIAVLGQRIFRIAAQDSEAAADQTITCLQTWLQSVKAPITLEQLGVPVDDIPTIAANAKGLARIWRLQKYTPERIAAVLQLCR